MFRNDVQCFFAHFWVFSLAFIAYIINKCSMTDGTKELFPLSYNVLVEKTKNTQKLFFKKSSSGVAGQISIFYTTLLRVLFRTP